MQQEVISKGSYTYAQRADLVSVKQYLIVREGEQNYLLLRMCNDRDETVTHLSFILKQFDVKGTLLRQDTFSVCELQGKSGMLFGVEDRFPLEDRCVDFRVELLSAGFGTYTYVVRGAELCAVYGRQPRKKEPMDKNALVRGMQGRSRTVSHKTMRAPILLLIVACAMVLSLVFCTAIQLRNFMRTEVIFSLDHVEYAFETDNRENGPICILRYTGKAGNIVFPEEIEGYPVARIANSAFADSKLNSVTVEGQVTVDDYAFANSKYLRSVTLSKATVLGEGVFENCNRLESVELGDRLERIGTRAFAACGALEQLTLPETVRELKESVFLRCDSLRSLALPSETAEIGANLLSGCEKLRELSLPYLGESAEHSAPLGYLFGDEDNVTVPKSLKAVTVTNADTVPKEGFVNCVSLEEITYEQELLSIGEYAFFGCAALEEMELTESLEELGAYAFGSCSSLTEVSIPASITTLEPSVFIDCTSLQTLVLPETLVKVDTAAFSGCSALEELTLPDSLQELGADVFLDCASLEEITLPFLGYTEWDSADIQATFGGSTTEALKAVTLTRETAVSPYAFDQLSALERVYLHEGVTAIGDGAFRGCVELCEVALPHAVQSVGVEAFFGCISLTDLTLPDGITELSDRVLAGCASLSELTMPNSVTAVGEEAFSGCVSLKNLFWSESLTSLGAGAFEGCAALKTVNLPGGISTVSDRAFADCRGLTAVMLSNAILEIGEDAFANCSALSEMILPAKVETVKAGAFRGCAKLTRAVVSDRVTAMGAGIFADCLSLEELTLPFLGSSAEEPAVLGYFFTADGEEPNTTVPRALRRVVLSGGESLTDHALSGCGSLRELELPETLTAIGISALRDCSSLQKILIPESVEELGAGAFFGCSSLKEIALPEGIREIGVMTFRSCSSLTALRVPTTVTSIGDQAFMGCTALSEIELPVKYGLTLGNSVFMGCRALTRASLGTNVQSIGSGIFSACTALEELTVPYVGSEAGVAQTMLYFLGAESASLRSVTVTGVADGVALADRAFDGCTALETVTLSELVTEIGANTLAQSRTTVKSLTIPFVGESLLDINTAAYLFGGMPVALEELTVTQATAIAAQAFAGCGKLEQVTLPEDLTQIGAWAFESCFNLKSFTVPEGASIATNAFTNCYKLYEVYNRSAADVSYIFSHAINIYSDTDTPVRVTTPEGLVFVRKLTDGAWYLVDYVGESTTLTLPERFANGAETVISYQLPSYLFCWDSEIEELHLSSSVTTMGERIFYNSSALKRVTANALQSNLTTIPGAAFYNCVELQSVMLPASVDTIASNAFQDCPKLYEVYNLTDLPISAGSTGYGYVAYHAYVVHESAGAEALHTVSIDGVNYLKSDDLWYLISYTGENPILHLSAFTYNGKAVNSIIIDRGAFAGNTVLTELSVDGVATEIREGAFQNMPNLKTLSFAGNGAIAEMDQSYVSGCSTLQTLVLPDSLTELSDDAFSGMSGLRTLVMGDGIVSIGASAFENCNNLVTVTLSDALETLGNRAFYGCRSLRTVTLPDGMSSMGEEVFSNCYSLQTISLSAGLERIPAYSFYGCTALRDIALPLSVRTVDDYAFSGCSSLRTAHLSERLTSIGVCAFDNCTSLTSVILPDSLVSLKGSAFSNSGLQTVTFGSGLTSIGEYAFSNSHSLQTVVLPANIKTVGDSAFQNCSGLRTVNARGVETIGYRAFYNCASLETLKLPYGLMHLGDQAFAQCSSLTAVTLPATLDTMGTYAFRNCTALTDLTVSDGVSQIGDNAFVGCTALRSVTIPGSVTSVGTGAFQNCTVLASLSLSSGVSQIGNYAFRNCTALTGLILPGTLTNLGSAAFSGCTALETVTMLDGLTSLPSSAFSDCTALHTVRMSSKITTIESSAFSNCRALDTITWPANLTTINSRAFYNCTSLREAMLPNGLRTVSSNAFANCTQLRTVRLPSSLTTINTGAFSGCYRLFEVIDLSSSIMVEQNSTENGSVGYYAGQISTSSTTPRVEFRRFTIDGVIYDFARVNNTVYLFAIEGYDANEVFELPQFTDGTYTVHRHALRRSLRKIIIPTCVTAILSDGSTESNLYGAIAYYRGTSTQWTSTPMDTSMNWDAVYFYTDCIHDNYSNLWMIDSKGNIVTRVSLSLQRSVLTQPTCEGEGTYSVRCTKCGESWKEPIPATGHGYNGTYNVTVKESTCTTKGQRNTYCSDCDELMWTTELPLLPHSLDKDGICTACGTMPITAQNFGTLDILTNTASNPFVIDVNGEIASTNKGDNSTASLTLTADSAMTVTFSYMVSSEENYDKLRIYVNGSMKKEVSGLTSYADMTVTLQAGDKLTFTYSKDGSVYHYDDCAYIKDLAITYQ